VVIHFLLLPVLYSSDQLQLPLQLEQEQQVELVEKILFLDFQRISLFLG